MSINCLKHNCTRQISKVQWHIHSPFRAVCFFRAIVNHMINNEKFKQTQKLAFSAARNALNRMARHSGGNIFAAKFDKLGLKQRSGGICENIQGMKIIQREKTAF